MSGILGMIAANVQTVRGPVGPLALEPPPAITRAEARRRIRARGELPTVATLELEERAVLEELAELVGGSLER